MLYEQSSAREECYRKLLQKVTGLVDYCEQSPASGEMLVPVRDQVLGLLAAHGVKPYTPEEGKPVDLKRCVIEVPVLSEEKEPGLVVKVITKGYIWGDITLVPARVAAIAEPPPKTQPDKMSGAESQTSLPQKHGKDEPPSPVASPSPTLRAENQTREGNPSKDERS